MKASEFLQSLTRLTREDLLEIKGIGEVLADNILEFTETERYSRLIEDFQKLEQHGSGITITQSPQLLNSAKSLPLSGQIIVITGTFPLPRPEIKEQLELLGAKVTGAISKSTTLLLAGEDAGSKLEKAKKLGIPIQETLDILNQ